jgi:hypothetical protein
MRPNRIADGRLSQPSIQRWFDVSAFSVPAQYTYGNAGRNILEGPGIRSWNCGLLKNFNAGKLREGAALQFRAEFFNFLNTPPFNNPVSNIQSSTAGMILGAGAPRQVQLALKATF